MIIEPVSVAEAVANELRRRLLAGEYPGGKELRDTELTEEFGAISMIEFHQLPGVVIQAEKILALPWTTGMAVSRQGKDQPAFS